MADRGLHCDEVVGYEVTSSRGDRFLFHDWQAAIETAERMAPTRRRVEVFERRRIHVWGDDGESE